MKLLVISSMALITFAFSSPYLYPQSWQSIFIGQPNDLTAICFPTQTTGYIFGIEAWYKSTNGGNNWNYYQFPYKVIEAEFLNSSTGYVLAKSSLQADTTIVLKTTNGGINWSNYRLSKHDTYRKVKFVNSTTGYVFTNREYFYRTTNGGLSWIYMTVPFWYYARDWDAYNNFVWCVGTDDLGGGLSVARIFRSSDNGANFNQISSISASNQYYGSYEVNILNEQIGYFSYIYGTGYTEPNRLGITTNGGSNWNQIYTGRVKNMYFINEDTGYGFHSFAQSSYIYRTINGGVNWASDTINEYINDIASEFDDFLYYLDHTSYIGEIGLDFSKEGIKSKDLQIESFKKVLTSIRGKRKIVSIHSRGAEKDVLFLLVENKIQNAIFHWYSGPLSLIKEIVARRYYFSINPAMIRSVNGKKIIQSIPKQFILTESDGPYISIDSIPVKPKNISLVLEYLSLLWGMSVK